MNEDKAENLLSWAWTILCNVSHGNWEMQSEEWVGAVESFRDQYHAHLSESGFYAEETVE